MFKEGVDKKEGQTEQDGGAGEGQYVQIAVGCYKGG